MNRIAVCLLIVCVSTSPSTLRAEFRFGDPVKLGSQINSSQSEVGHPSSDGLSLYVSRSRSGSPAELYVTRRASLNDAWGSLDDVNGELNDSGSVGIVSTTSDELSMYFSGMIAHFRGQARDSDLGQGDIWLSERLSTDSTFGEPINLGAPINTSYLEADPTISADGLTMVFTSDRPGGFARLNSDLWESRRDSIDSPWQEPQNLGSHVNRGDNHMTPTISADGLTVVYAISTGNNQTSDLWAVNRDNIESPWNAPVKLGGKLNTTFEFNPQLSADGSTLYYSQWNFSTEFDMVEVPLLPFEAVSLSAGSEAYSQDFDQALGSNGGQRGTVLPTGWTVSDNGIIFNNATDRAFPVSSTFGSAGNPILNAGAEGDSDRTLAIGANDRNEGGMIQLLADVTGNDATSLQLQFDVEAWDARTSSRTDDPGEGAFQVHVDIDRGDGYERLADLGTVTTGLLPTPAEAYLDGNSPENRVSFDSGQIGGSIPAGSTLRVRWKVDRNAQTNNWVFGLDNVLFSLFGGNEVMTELVAGDADQDLDFDQLDLVKVQIANKYLTGQPATWGEGDWNGAPGGSAGSPPTGDGLFDQFDVIAANVAGVYLQGPYAAIQSGGTHGDGQTSLVYNAGTGELSVDAPAGAELTSINVTSAAGRFAGEKPAALDGAFDNFAADNVFKASFGSSFGSISFGNVLPPGIAEGEIAADLSAVGSLAGGGDLGNVDLIYVPEPSAILLFTMGLAIGLRFFKRVDR